jgi:ribosomal protein S18 acetylase RimI-like enzyme
MYRIEPTRLQAGIGQLIVHPDHRRRRVGSQLLEELQLRLQTLGPVRLLAVAADTQLDYHLFLRAHGFRAIEVHRGLFGEADGYLFERASQAAPCRLES